MGLFDDIFQAAELKVLAQELEDKRTFDNVIYQWDTFKNTVVKYVKDDELSEGTAENILEDVQREYRAYINSFDIVPKQKREDMKKVIV